MYLVRKIWIVVLFFCFLTSVAILGVGKGVAIGTLNNIEIVVGNLKKSASTNMVIKIKLKADLVCGNYMDINFAHANMATDFTVSDVNAVLVDDTTADMELNATYTDNNTIAFDHLHNGASSSPCVTLTTGTVIEFYLGPSDSVAAGYVTGEDANFNGSATHVITNYFVGFQENVSISGSGINDFEGVYAFGPTTKDVSANVMPFTKIELNQSTVDFGDMDTQSVLVNDDVTINVGTNAKSGYVFRYRATDFNNLFGNNSISVLEDGGGSGDPFYVENGVEGWGINFLNNTGLVAGDAGAVGSDPSNSSGGYTLLYPYNDIDYYYVDVSGDFSTIANSITAPGQAIYTMSAVLATATTTSTGSYEGDLIFNVYAKF